MDRYADDSPMDISNPGLFPDRYIYFLLCPYQAPEFHRSAPPVFLPFLVICTFLKVLRSQNLMSMASSFYRPLFLIPICH